MKIEEVVEAWKKNELSGDAAMCVIHDILYPAEIEQEDIDWAKNSSRIIWRKVKKEDL